MINKRISLAFCLVANVLLPVAAESLKPGSEHAPVRASSESASGASPEEALEADKLAHTNHEAIAAHKAKNYELAANLIGQVVAGLEKEEGSDLSLSEALGNQSIIFLSQGKAKESQESLNRALAIRKRYHMPPAEKQLVDILPTSYYRRQGSEMVRETADIVDGHDPLYPPDKLPVKTAEAWASTMLSAQHCKRVKDSKKEFLELRKALAIANSLPKPNDKIVSSMNLLADAYRNMGRPYSARVLFMECLALDEKLGKSKSPEYATLLDHAGQTLIVLHEYADAEKLLERAIELYKNSLGAENADLAMTMSTLGELYIQQKQEAKGEKLLLDALAMMKKLLKADDLRLLTAEDNLAAFYSRHGKLKEAEELQRGIAAKMEKSSGKASPDLAVAVNNLAQTLYREQKYAEAEPLMRRCIEINQQCFGPRHIRTLHSMGAYASFLEKTGHGEEAQKIIKQITAP